MTTKTSVFIVCSLAGRVGSTMTARLLCDYFLVGQRPFRCFDTDAHEPDLAQRFPDNAAVVDISAIQGQMALIDPLLENDGVPKVVDLWHRALEPFFVLLDHTGFVDEARARGVEPILLYVDDGTPRTAEVVARIADRYPGLQIITVQNESTGQNISNGPELPHIIDCFRIGRLDPTLGAMIERPGFSLASFILEPPSGMSIVLRAALRDWLHRIFSQFKSFELRMTLNESQHLS